MPFCFSFFGGIYLLLYWVCRMGIRPPPPLPVQKLELLPDRDKMHLQQEADSQKPVYMLQSYPTHHFWLYILSNSPLKHHCSGMNNIKEFFFPLSITLCRIATEKTVHTKIKTFTFIMKTEEVLMWLNNSQCLCISELILLALLGLPYSPASPGHVLLFGHYISVWEDF